jgi:hypothetical protein
MLLKPAILWQVLRFADEVLQVGIPIVNRPPRSRPFYRPFINRCPGAVEKKGENQQSKPRLSFICPFLTNSYFHAMHV